MLIIDNFFLDKGTLFDNFNQNLMDKIDINLFTEKITTFSSLTCDIFQKKQMILSNDKFQAPWITNKLLKCIKKT